MNGRPHGAEEVRSAVLRAARKRFAAEGPGASLRDIAAEAQVNLGLLHRHFGNKAALLAAVLTDVVHRAQRDTAEASGVDDVLDLLLDGFFFRDDSESEEYVRILAWMLLAGDNPREYQKEFWIRRHTEAAGPQGRTLLLLVLAAGFGWRIFGPHLSAIVSSSSPAGASDELRAVLRHVVASALADMDRDRPAAT
jgi:AcrR family transcriptional regulator